MSPLRQKADQRLVDAGVRAPDLVLTQEPAGHELVEIAGRSESADAEFALDEFDL